MQTQVQRIVFPRDRGLYQDGWISYVVRTEVHLFWAAISQLDQSSTAIEHVLSYSRDR